MAQLRKNPPFEINAEDPFQEDKLNQKPSIELLSILLQSTDQPFVITVEAPWGWGKTKFIERWKASLAKQGHACLYFNAWENDFVTDPLIAFVGELRPIVEKSNGGMDETSSIRKGFARLSRLGAGLAKKGAPIVIKAAAAKVLSADAVKEMSEIVADSAEQVAEIISESVKKQIERYDEDKNGIKEFRSALPATGKKFEYAGFQLLVETTLKVVFLPLSDVRDELIKLEQPSATHAEQNDSLRDRKFRMLEHLFANREMLIRLIDFSGKFN